MSKGSASVIKLASTDIGDEEVAAVRTALMSGVLTNGPFTAAFEEAFARRHDVAHAVAFANGTVALSAIYIALGIREGDEVVVPSMTFVSTATSVLHVGARPVFAEVDEETFNIDPDDVRKRITARTKAIVAVHYGGQPADLAELLQIADDAGIDLIEDAAQAHGAAYQGRPVGDVGRAAMFSFTPMKNITTGEGGIVTTKDSDLARQLRLLRNHGQTRLYQHSRLGYNWRLTEMQAAMGVVQVGKLDAILARKAANDAYIRMQIVEGEHVKLPVARSDRTHPYTLYTLRLHDKIRDRVLESLIESDIEARLYFPPTHLQPIFRDVQTSLPRTENLARQLLSIPFHSRLSRVELDRIAAAVNAAVNLALQ